MLSDLQVIIVDFKKGIVETWTDKFTDFPSCGGGGVLCVINDEAFILLRKYVCDLILWLGITITHDCILDRCVMIVITNEPSYKQQREFIKILSECKKRANANFVREAKCFIDRWYSRITGKP